MVTKVTNGDRTGLESGEGSTRDEYVIREKVRTRWVLIHDFSFFAFEHSRGDTTSDVGPYKYGEKILSIHFVSF